MDATWFDRYRGWTQGRIAPTDCAPADGARAFLLGEDAPEEAAQVTTGDYTEVRQVVDLTDYDLVGATLRTIGRAASQHAVAPNWARDAAELLAFNFDFGTTSTPNLVAPAGEAAGFALASVGGILYPRETYTGARRRCRAVPTGTAAATHLTGANTPAVGTPGAALPAYTLQWWWAPRLDAIAASSGWDIDVLRLDAVDPADGLRYGLRLEMRGLIGPGAHSWSPYLTHYAGATQAALSLSSLYAATTDPGWQQVTITYDAAVSPAEDRISLYVDAAAAGHPAAAIGASPTYPPAGGAVQYAHRNGWGAWDAVRLLRRALTATEVATTYAAATTFGLSAATQWVQRLLVDGVAYAARPLDAAERRSWTDFVAPVRHLTGLHEVAWRLSLEDA